MAILAEAEKIGHLLEGFGWDGGRAMQIELNEQLQSELVLQAQERKIPPDTFALQVIEGFLAAERLKRLPASPNKAQLPEDTRTEGSYGARIEGRYALRISK
jgi:hypothetical protein